jgi:hypothetical protein
MTTDLSPRRAPHADRKDNVRALTFDVFGPPARSADRPLRRAQQADQENSDGADRNHTTIEAPR